MTTVEVRLQKLLDQRKITAKRIEEIQREVGSLPVAVVEIENVPLAEPSNVVLGRTQSTIDQLNALIRNQVTLSVMIAAVNSATTFAWRGQQISITEAIALRNSLAQYKQLLESLISAQRNAKRRFEIEAGKQAQEAQALATSKPGIEVKVNEMKFVELPQLQAQIDKLTQLTKDIESLDSELTIVNATTKVEVNSDLFS